jgi:hypothetical protein
MNAQELRALSLSRNYEQIHAQIQAELQKLPVFKGLAKGDTEDLKALVEAEVKKAVCAMKAVPAPLVNIVLLLGRQFEDHVRGRIASYLSPQLAADYQQFLNSKFQRLSSLKECFAWIDDSLTRMALRYSNLPVEWNLVVDTLICFYTLTKQKMCDYFFFCEILDADFVEGLDLVVKYEKKFMKILLGRGCCLRTDRRLDEQVLDCDEKVVHTAPTILRNQCCHVSMLSSLFLPNIKIYLRASFESVLKDIAGQDGVEMHIMAKFLVFFRSLERIYKKIEYFGDRDAYRDLLQCFDAYLAILVRNIEPENGIYGAAIVLNTLVFVKETTNEFMDQLHEKADGAEMRAWCDISNAERHHSSSIDRFFHSYFRSLNFGSHRGLGARIICFLESHVTTDFFKGLSDEVQISLVESIISNILFKIHVLKIGPDAAEALLGEMGEVKQYLRTKINVLPLMDAVEKFLKIFLCSAERKEDFIDNFGLVSDGIFSFNQIIRSIGRQEVADELSVIYSQRAGALPGKDDL